MSEGVVAHGDVELLAFDDVRDERREEDVERVLGRDPLEGGV